MSFFIFLYLLLVGFSWFGMYMVIAEDRADAKAGRKVASRRDYLGFVFLFIILGILPILQLLPAFCIASELFDKYVDMKKLETWLNEPVLEDKAQERKH